MKKHLRTIRMALLARRFGHLGAGCSVSRRAIIVSPAQISIGGHCEIADGVFLSGKSEKTRGLVLDNQVSLREYAWLSASGGHIEIGDRTVIGPFAMIYGMFGCNIGSDVLIGGQTIVIPGNHVFVDPTIPIAAQGNWGNGVVIEDDVWIGANCVILDGVRIGRGAVIGAGSIITKNVSRYTVVHGAHARPIRARNIPKLDSSLRVSEEVTTNIVKE